MADYDKGEGLSDDDTTTVMLVTEDDPVTFEEAIKRCHEKRNGGNRKEQNLGIN